MAAVGPSGAVALLGTYLLLALGLSLTAHLAARNVLGDVPGRRAVLVGPLPAAVPFLLQRYFPLLVVGVALAIDLTVIRLVYRLKWRTAGFVTFVHLVVSIILGVIVGGLLALLSTAPG